MIRSLAILALLLTAADPPGDDSAALNARIREVASAGGGTVDLEPRAYSVGAALDGRVANVTLKGVPGATSLVKTVAPSSDGITSFSGAYSGWTFEGVAFDGNARAIAAAGLPPTFSLPLGGTRGVRFVRCTIRDVGRGVVIRDAEDVTFEACSFYGTRPGIFDGGTFDPPAVPDAGFSSGIELIGPTRRLLVSHCRFHFPSNGIAASTASTQRVEDLTVSGCSFVSDWWDSPGATLRFMATKAEVIPGGFKLTRPAGGLKAAFGANQVCSFRRELAGGQAFTRLFGDEVSFDGPVNLAVAGDVVETADGRRARIGGVGAVDGVSVEGWQDLTTYEPTSGPPPQTPWRIVRYYGGIGTALSDTEVAVLDPLCPYTGERLGADVKADLTRLAARGLVKAGYPGIHVNAGVVGLLVDGNSFRGSWADQCSIFNSADVRILGNRFLYGQDEGVTLTLCPRSIVASNVFVNCGVSAVWIGSSDFTTIQANSIRNWGLMNPYVGAIDGSGKGYTIGGNSFVGDLPKNTNKAANGCAITLREADCTGTTISANTDGASLMGTLSVDKAAAPKKNAITVRDIPAARVMGTGKSNVKVTN